MAGGFSTRRSGPVTDLLRAARTSLWLIPVLCLLAGAALSFVTIAVDDAHDFQLLPAELVGSPSGAQQILGTIAQSVVQLAALVLSLSLVVIQLAMGQFSPRIVRSLLNDRRSQWAIGILVGTAAFSILSIRHVGVEAGDGGYVPGLTMLVAYVLGLASFAALLLFVHHTGQSLRVAGLIDLVGDDLRDQITHRYPESLPAVAGGEEATGPEWVHAPEPGVVYSIDVDRLVEEAVRADCRLELLPMMGDFVPAGAPLLHIHGDPGQVDHDALAGRIGLGAERTHDGDPAYGFRKLVDIAERSIADPFDDPTTAVQAIDRLHDCLRQLASLEMPDGEHRDAAGELRLSVREIGWEGYVRLAFDEVRLAAASSPQVDRRLAAALEDLLGVVPRHRRPPVERQLRLLRAGVDRAFENEDDIAAATIPDLQGIGSGPDLVR